MNKPGHYDAIIIGAGHNGLVCGFYLARAGLRVKILEARPVVGGAAVTEEFHPGFRNSVGAYTVSLLNPRIIDDMGLHRHGLKIVERPVSNLWPQPDGRYLALGGRADMVREIGKFSKKDAAAAAGWFAALGRVADVLRDQVLRAPPNAGGGLRDALGALMLGNRLRRLGLADQQLLFDMLSKSAAEILDLWFESEIVKGAIAFDSIVGFYGSPYEPGSAYVLLHHAFGEVNGKKGQWGHAIGGMGAISQAMAKTATGQGVDIECDSPVAAVLTGRGRVTGVECTDGRQFRAPVVAANVTPRLLFDKLLPEAAVPPEFSRRMKGWKCASGVLRMNVALKTLPDFSCLKGIDAEQRRALLGAGIVIGPDVAYLHAAIDDARRLGWSRRPIIEMLIPSLADNSLAPAGGHVASLFCQQFAYRLPDGRRWEDEADKAADHVIDTVDGYAPGFGDSVIGRMVLSPRGLEKKFGLTGGDIFHGALTLDQIFSARPMLGHAAYRMPLGGLYLCGSGAHPGGGVTGAPGHNAARAIIGAR